VIAACCRGQVASDYQSPKSWYISGERRKEKEEAGDTHDLCQSGIERECLFFCSREKRRLHHAAEKRKAVT
jgi:hypothetical protein